MAYLRPQDRSVVPAIDSIEAYIDTLIITWTTLYTSGLTEPDPGVSNQRPAASHEGVD